MTHDDGHVEKAKCDYESINDPMTVKKVSSKF